MKIFKRIILAILIISILLIGSITLMGYIMYHNAISQTSIADKIAEIKSNENYTSINDIPDNFKIKNHSISYDMKLKLLKKYDKEEWSVEKLKEYGVKAIRSPRRLPKILSEELIRN